MLTSIKKLGIFWGVGLAMFVLRLYDNANCFHPATGLYLGGTTGLMLGAVAIAALLLSLLLSLRGGKDRPLFSAHFATPERSTTALVLAALLFVLGGAVMGKNALSEPLRVAPLVTAAFAFFSGVFLLSLTRQMRRGEANSLTATLPLMFFGAFWVLTLYLPAASDPILARYWLPILAAAVNAYAFAQLAGFFRGETKVRTFRFVAGYAVALSVAACAELNAHSILFAACALLLSVFLALEGETDP